MNKQSLVLFLFTTGAIVASGCEPDGGKVALVGDTSALVGDEAADESTSETTEAAPKTNDSEIAPYPVLAIWSDGAELTAQADLSFELTNITSDENLALIVSVESRSLIGDAGKPLGDLSLEPGESASFSLAANELPVLSDIVISQMAVGIRQTDPATGWVGKMHLESLRFYRHEAGLGSLRAYTSESLASELDGVLYQSDLPPTETSDSALESETLGYVADASGEPQPVALADTGLVSHDAEGSVDGVTTGCRIGVGDASGEGATTAPEEDPTMDGPAEHEEEVADE